MQTIATIILALTMVGNAELDRLTDTYGKHIVDTYSAHCVQADNFEECIADMWSYEQAMEDMSEEKQP